nr:hypothetical protein [uncultured Allomuricauda sp.]
MKRVVKSVVLICLLSVFATGHSQKGMGESKGVASKGITPELVTLKGVIQEIKKGPCTYTTGKSTSGTHLIINTAHEVVLNVHLGPTKKVSEFVDNSINDEIEIIAFRTEKLPKDHYIAKELIYNDDELVLRDEYLRPFWANKRSKGFWK